MRYSLLSFTTMVYVTEFHSLIQLSFVLTNQPLKHIFENADEDSFLERTGFNHRSLGILVNILFPNSVRRQFGRSRLLDEKDRLGSYLLNSNSRMTYNNLCLCLSCC